MGPIFFSAGDSRTKGLLLLLHSGLEDVTKVETDPKRRFVSFNINPSNDRVFFVYGPSGHNTRKQLARGHFFEEIQNYMENKSEGIENKIILGDFNCTVEKMDRDGGNKTQRLYTYGSNYALSKFIVNNGLDDLWRSENLDCSEFTHYDRSSATGSRIDRVYNDIKITNNNKINHIMVSFTDHYNAISLDRPTLKTKTGKD